MAGRFYPDNPEELARIIDQYITAADIPALSGKPIAFIVPHAGYIFSGPVAGYAYSIIKNLDTPTVLIVGLAHRYPLKGASLYAEGAYETPLGRVPINENLCKKILSASPLIEYIPEAHEEEHSVEVQIPFLQRSLDSFTIIPMLIGNPSLSVCKEISTALAETIKNENIILLASTDLSHYPAYDKAVYVDNQAIDAIKSLSPENLQTHIHNLMRQNIPNLSCVLCGEGAVQTVMYTARALGADQAYILKYANSGDSAQGSKNSVVGYLSAVFTKSKEGSLMHEDEKIKEESFSIKPENQKTLLQIARKSISTFLSKQKLAHVSARGDEELSHPGAVFVTLTKHGMLRGCIGTTEPRYPLIDAVNQLAVSSACQDHRFPPVSPDELNEIHIEISVLSPLKKISSHKEIKPDIHGVVVAKGNHQGLFLPQVWEHFPGDKEAFMGELCAQKAGLPRDAWKKDKDVELSVFTVFKFEEPEKE